MSEFYPQQIFPRSDDIVAYAIPYDQMQAPTPNVRQRFR